MPTAQPRPGEGPWPSAPATEEAPWRPTAAQIAAARGATLPDVVAPDLRVLFVGINPGLYTAAVGHHFGRPGNRFWKVLHLAGFTDVELTPFQERRLLAAGAGITNLVPVATASAGELTRAQLRGGAERLQRLACALGPRIIAFCGMGAYRTAFGRPHARMGEQPERLCRSRLWLLPNPSGLQARYQLAEMVTLFAELHRAAMS